MATKLNTKGTLKQDLVAARAELKQFRHDVSMLKKKGILDKELYDARSVLPTKYLKAQIKLFQNVLSGAAVPVKVSKAKKAYYKEKGYTVKGNRVIVPVQPNEKAYSSHGDFRVKVTGKGGSITKIDLGLDPHDINQWAKDLRNSKYKLRSDEILRFQLFGNNSYAGFANLPGKTAQQRMAEYIENYPLFEDTSNELDPSKVQEIIQGITIFKIKRNVDNESYELPPKNAAAKMKDEEYVRRAAERRKRNYSEKIGRMNDARYDAFRKERSESTKNYRVKLTPDEREAYKAAAKARAKKSRENRKRR